MLKKINRQFVVDLLFILILSLTPLLWFKEGTIMVGHDNVFPLNPIEFFKGRLFTWNQQNFGRDQSTIMGTIPIHLIDALPYFLGFSLQVTQKIVYIFWFFLIGLAAYVLASTIKPQSRFFHLVVVILYQFNFFLLQAWWIGERTKFSAYIALPLCLSVFIRVIQGKLRPLKAASLIALILFVFNAGGLFGIPLYGGFLVSLIIFIFYFSLMGFLEKKTLIIKRIILTTLLACLGFLLVNLYYLLPALYQFLSEYQGQMQGVGGKSGLLDWAEMISIGTSFINLFRLQGMADWYDNSQHPYASCFLKNPIFIAFSFLWPLLAFSAPILIKKKERQKLVLYFLFVYLIGIFFAAGTHPPLGFLYRLLVKFLPGFAIFRTPFYKFAPAIFLANAFLAAFTLDWLKERMSKRKLLKFLFGFFCLILILAYHFPYFQGEFFNFSDHFSTRLVVPDYVFEFGRWINEEKKDDLRVLILPQLNEDWEYDLYRWGYLSLFPLPKLLTNQAVLLNDETLTSSERELLHLIYESLLNNDKRLFEKLAPILRIGYLLVRQDYDDDLNWAPTASTNSYQIDYPLVKNWQQWQLYRLDTKPLPKIYGLYKPAIVAFSLNNLKDVYSAAEISPQTSLFLKNDDLEKFPSQGSYSLFPECLSCQIEQNEIPFMLPSPFFLPDSPFYFLVQIKEKFQNPPLHPKGKMEDQIGYSLKRLMELDRMLKVKNKKEKDILQAIYSYQKTLDKIESHFLAIPDLDEKNIAAENLAIYLEIEEKKLKEFHYEYTCQIPCLQSIKTELEQIIKELNNRRERLRPYLFDRDLATSKFFSSYLSSGEEFRVLLNRNILDVFDDKAAKISLKIDDQPTNNLYQLKRDWLDFGEYFLSSGQHRLQITIPPTPSLLSEWEISEKLFAPELKEGSEEAPLTELKNCLTAKITPFSPQEKYAVDLAYHNYLLEDLFYFGQGERKSREEDQFFKPDIKMNLHRSSYPNENRILILPKKDDQDFQIGFCSRDLTLENFQKIFTKVEVKRLVTPVLFLKSVSEEETGLIDLTFQEINPTQYLLTVKDRGAPFVLSFLERFSSGWQFLPPVNSDHFQTFNYANSWIIEGNFEGDLTLKYLPQGLFVLGQVVSLVSFLLIILILKFKP